MRNDIWKIFWFDPFSISHDFSFVIYRHLSLGWGASGEKVMWLVA
jgi:hypothetical protein